MRAMVEKILNQFGTEIHVQGKTVRGIFQPVTGKLERLATPSVSPMGKESRERYLYIGPVEPKANAGDTLIVDDKSYWLRRTELVRDSNGPVYCWGMCVEKGGEDTWGQS